MSYKKISFFISSLIYMIFISLRGWIPVSNISFYVCACALFFISAMTCLLVFNKKQPAMLSSKSGELCISVLSILTFIIWTICFFIAEPALSNLEDTGPLRQTRPFYLWFPTILGCTALVLFLLHLTRNQTRTKRQLVCRIVISLLFTLCVAPLFYAPNFLEDIQGGTYHSTAYTNSIIMACWRTPYSWRMHDYYGHYAIFYMPILKILRSLFGINFWLGICIVTTIIASITILGYLYVLNHFVKNDVLYYLSMAAIGAHFFMRCPGGIYYQLFPHRFLFPILTVAFAIWEKKRWGKSTPLSNAIIIILLTFGTVWSVEVGCVALLSFVAYRWLDALYDGNAFHPKKLLSLCKYFLLFFVLPFVLAYFVVGLYNVWAGASLFMDFKEYMYPLISDKGYISNIELPLPGVSALWVGVTILFLVIICITLFPVLFQKASQPTNRPLYFLMALMSMGALIYYINRPVYGCMSIVMFYAIIFLDIILEKSIHHILTWREANSGCKIYQNGKALFYGLIRFIGVFILMLMWVDSVIHIPVAYKTAAETIWKADKLEEFAQYVWVQIPPQAFYIGEGVPELAAFIDRDPSFRCSEWSINNMTKEEEYAIQSDLKEIKPQWMFWNLASLAQIQDHYPDLTDGYDLHEVMEYNDMNFGFFVREE